MEHGNMQTDQLKKHLQLFTEGTAVPPEDLPGGDAPSPAASQDSFSGPELAKRVQTIDGKKVVMVTAAEEAKIRELFGRMDALLKSHTDKDGNFFESVDFDSMTQSEQHRFILQNLHLLSEADQMVVLRGLVNEAGGMGRTAVDLAKAGFTNVIKPVAKFAYNDVIKPVVSHGYSDIVLPLLRKVGYGLAGVVGTVMLAGTAVTVWKAPWNKLFQAIFPDSPAIDQELSAEELAEYRSIEQEWSKLLTIPTDYLANNDIWLKFSDSLNADMNEYATRWKKFTEAMAKRKQTPPTPPLDQRLKNLIK
jgi:hypothetical protein